MVKTEPDIVLAFPLPQGRGTQHCIKIAEAAGLQVIITESEEVPMPALTDDDHKFYDLVMKRFILRQVQLLEDEKWDFVRAQWTMFQETPALPNGVLFWAKNRLKNGGRVEWEPFFFGAVQALVEVVETHPDFKVKTWAVGRLLQHFVLWYNQEKSLKLYGLPDDFAIGIYGPDGTFQGIPF